MPAPSVMAALWRRVFMLLCVGMGLVDAVRGEVQSHWAYRPIPPLALNQAAGVDAYVDRWLQARGLVPALEASRDVLLRRLSFDLVGLPPSEEQWGRWKTLAWPEAYPEIVDELLASRHFGEHWARHWFDIVRYAESVTLRGFVFKNAWRYRDYVIESLNEDRPLDLMIREHVAGDLMEGGDLKERQRRMAALTFLMLGNTNLEEQDKRQLEMDVVDEQLDVMGKAFLGQTISCARCHDHKFDPIPTRDYYAMAGILRNVVALKHDNVSGWTERPLPLDEAAEKQYEALGRQRVELRSELQGAREKRKAVEGGRQVGKGRPGGVVVDSSQAKRVGEWILSQHHKPFIGDGYLHDANAGKGVKTLTFQPESLPPGRYEVWFIYTHGDNRAPRVPVTVYHAEGENTVHVDERKSSGQGEASVSLGVFRFEASGFSHVLVSNEGTEGHVIADAVEFVPVGGRGEAAVASVGAAGSGGDGGEGARWDARVRDLEGEIKRVEAMLAQRPMVMAPTEAKDIVELAVHRRGSVHQLGETVPRGFPTMIEVKNASPPGASSSGRRELAEWLVNRANPLTPRVMANRVWLWMMGEGLVRTPDNWGTTGEAPVHQDLLDLLARRWMDGELRVQGVQKPWSLKALVREIALTQLYRRSSTPPGSGESVRGEGWTHALRKQLTAEQLRDAMLWVSGDLVLEAPQGPVYPSDRSSDYGYVEVRPMRSVYVPAFRNALPDALSLFNYPVVSAVTGQRDRNIVPTQSLYLMNDPWVRRCAERAVQLGWARLQGRGVEERLDWFYGRVLGRVSTAREKQVVREYLGAGDESSERWVDVVQAMLTSPEFRLLW